MSNLNFVDAMLGQGLRQTNTNGFAYKNCKRQVHDRRTLSSKSIWHSIFTGRRRAVQRQTCKVSSYIIDTHESWLLIVVLGALVLSITDACLTLVLLQHGAAEVNPLMAMLLANGMSLFFWVKFSLTFVSLMTLLIFKNFTLFRYFNGYHFLALTFLFYIGLIRYELMLLNSI